MSKSKRLSKNKKISKLPDILLSTVVGVVHQLDSFTFKNSEGKAVNDLHVQFKTKAKSFRVKDKDKFKKTICEKTKKPKGYKVTFSGTDIPNGKSITPEFEATSDFKIVGWQWTKDKEGVGGVKQGPPEE